METRDERRDSGQYYPGGRVIARPGTAPQQIVVQWTDVQGKPQIAPLPDRYRESDMKGKINEIASKFATVLMAALIGWSAFGELVVQKAQKDQIWNDEEIVTNAYLTGENASGAARPLPKYLHALDFDDSYPDEAEEYYELRAKSLELSSAPSSKLKALSSFACSAVRDGGYLYRNYDWKFDDAAEFVVRVSATAERFASVGVANCGTNLTERFVTSGKPSRYYKCLPGRTVDGINENGVVCEVNVMDGDPQEAGWPTNGTIHCMAAVRWVLDNATSAEGAAIYLAEHLFFPAGLSQNFHWMLADGRETWVVENHTASRISGRAVMTNFRLYPPSAAEGQERYYALMAGANITSQWWTLTYTPTGYRASDLPGISGDALTQLFDYWASKPREEHRGESLGGESWWQTVHTSVYDITNRTLRVAVQETDDWYTFAVPSAGGVRPGAVREIVSATKIATSMLTNRNGAVMVDLKDVVTDILTPSGGETWKDSGTSAGSWYSVTFGNGRYVAGNHDYGIWYSDDGVNWTQSSKTNGYVTALAYDGGLFVAGFYSDGLWYSTDGVSWTQSGETSKQCYAITYGSGRFVAGTFRNGILYSYDGITWNQSSRTAGAHISAAFGDGTFVVGSRTTGIYRSYDGVAWEKVEVTPKNWPAMFYHDGRFIASPATGGIWSSTNGYEWTMCENTDGMMINGFAYGNGHLVAVGGSGHYYSEDGMAWTYCDQPDQGGYNATYGDGRFVSVGSRGIWYSDVIAERTIPVVQRIRVNGEIVEADSNNVVTIEAAGGGVDTNAVKDIIRDYEFPLDKEKPGFDIKTFSVFIPEMQSVPQEIPFVGDRTWKFAKIKDSLDELYQIAAHLEVFPEGDEHVRFDFSGHLNLVGVPDMEIRLNCAEPWYDTPAHTFEGGVEVLVDGVVAQTADLVVTARMSGLASEHYVDEAVAGAGGGGGGGVDTNAVKDIIRDYGFPMDKAASTDAYGLKAFSVYIPGAMSRPQELPWKGGTEWEYSRARATLDELYNVMAWSAGPDLVWYRFTGHMIPGGAAAERMQINMLCNGEEWFGEPTRTFTNGCEVVMDGVSTLYNVTVSPVYSPIASEHYVDAAVKNAGGGGADMAAVTNVVRDLLAPATNDTLLAAKGYADATTNAVRRTTDLATYKAAKSAFDVYTNGVFVCTATRNNDDRHAFHSAGYHVLYYGTLYSTTGWFLTGTWLPDAEIGDGDRDAYVVEGDVHGTTYKFVRKDAAPEPDGGMIATTNFVADFTADYTSAGNPAFSNAVAGVFDTIDMPTPGFVSDGTNRIDASGWARFAGGTGAAPGPYSLDFTIGWRGFNKVADMVWQGSNRWTGLYMEATKMNIAWADGVWTWEVPSEGILLTTNGPADAIRLEFDMDGDLTSFVLPSRAPSANGMVWYEGEAVESLLQRSATTWELSGYSEDPRYVSFDANAGVWHLLNGDVPGTADDTEIVQGDFRYVLPPRSAFKVGLVALMSDVTNVVNDIGGGGMTTQDVRNIIHTYEKMRFFLDLEEKPHANVETWEVWVPGTERNPAVVKWNRDKDHVGMYYGSAFLSGQKIPIEMSATWEGTNWVFRPIGHLPPAMGGDLVLPPFVGDYAEYDLPAPIVKLYIRAYQASDLATIADAKDEADKVAAKLVGDVDGKVAELRGEIAAKAPKAWGSLASDGLIAPSNTLVIREASTVFAGGHAFERVNVGSGTFGFLVSRGAAAYTGEPGTFRFRDAVSGEYFGYAKSSFVVPLHTDDIYTSTNLPGVVTLVYRVTVDGYPIINYKPTLENFSQTAWEPLNDAAGNPLPGATYAPAWEDPDPEPGMKVCHINIEGTTQGFFCGSIATDGNSVFETNMPADLKGGIVAPSADDTDVRYVVEPFVEGGEVKWRIKQ